MDTSINGYVKQTPTNVLWVWFEGSTALKEGQGVCYNFDYGTATAADGRRVNRVELPSTTNARYFAGVSARYYSAKTGGQFIEVYGPGSTCNVLVGASVTLGSGIITCQAGGTDAGVFTYAGFEGEGSAVPLQTVDGSSTDKLCLAKLQVGQPSGLVEALAVVDNDAVVPMVGGVTYIVGSDITGGNCTATLADGTISGIRKAFNVAVAVSTSDFVLTVTSGEQRVKTTDGAVVALASATFDAQGEKILLEWQDGVWKELYSSGATLASS